MESIVSKLTCWAVLTLCLLGPAAEATAQEPEIFAIRYGSVDDFPLRGLLPDASDGELIDIALAFWLVRQGDRVILVDSGFFREEWFDRFDIRDFVRPDLALSRLGVDPADVTDVVISHSHWDHMGGLELFPDAVVWIQEAEYTYYTGAAWQPGGNSGGIDPADVAHLVDRNTSGSVRLVQGDGVEILPGISVFTGATFEQGDRDANLAAVKRMVELAGDPERVIPGHDAEVFRRFPSVAEGVVQIHPGGRVER